MTLFELMQKQGLLNEGGAGGHMKHPYEKYTTPEELLKFFNDFLAGKFAGTEKVDGYNLFAGFNKQGKVVAVRNKTHPPIENITNKFGLTHGAYEGFSAGWKAIKSGLDRLSKEDRVKYKLVDEDDIPINFINLEILFGYIPNVVPYSRTVNFIVFHTLAGAPSNDWDSPGAENEKKLLKQLADKLGTASVTSTKVKYEGDPGKIQRETKPVKSYWEFKGPIKIQKDNIKSELKNIVQQWQSYPEVKKLKEFSKRPVPAKDSDKYEEYDDERFKLMKAVTKRIGKEVLGSMVSKLSDTGQVISGHPGMEGIALDIEGDLIKITGDFLDFNKPEDIPSVDATKSIREKIQNDILGMSVKTLSSLKDKTTSGLIDFVLAKRKKKYTYEINEKVPQEKIRELRDLVAEGQHDIAEALKVVRNKGREFDERSLLVQSFLLSSFKDKLEKVQTYEELLSTYGEVFYNIKA